MGKTYLADTADVLVPRLLVEPEVLVQPEADVVPVEAVRELVQVQEVLLERARDRRLLQGDQRGERYTRAQGVRTFPLALSPVNQTVAPFCVSSCARSSALTDPASDRPQSKICPYPVHSRARDCAQAHRRTHQRGK